MLPRLISLTLAPALISCSTAPPPSPAPAPTLPMLPTAFDAGWHGVRICEPLYENAQVRAARCTFPPGGGHERHSHPPHWGYILQGSVMQTTNASGTSQRTLQSGASWWSDGVTWHETVNIGTETAVYIIVELKGGKQPARIRNSR
jgi:beta-alanine degradation protein BauB